MAAVSPTHSVVGLLMSCFLLIFPFIWIIIAYFKRKQQIRRSWTAPLSAKVSIQSIPLLCKHCQKEEFYKREALIGTTYVTYFSFFFLNQSGAAYECKSCGYLHWFSRPQETEVIFHQNSEEA